jgi:uncharacterized protein YdhG (YjbR/CyaY superfamily)
MPQKFNTIDEYIDSFPEKTKEQLTLLRSTIRQAAPQAKEAFSYGVPAFKLNGNLVLFAAFKNHIGFYPTPSVMKKFREELSKFETSEGTVRFPLGQPLPLKLISKIVEFRVGESFK